MNKLLRTFLGILSGIFWTILMLSFSNFRITLLTIFAALIHEFGHLAMLFVLKKELSIPRLVASGFRIKTKSVMSYKEEILICATGPASNILFFVLSAPFMPCFSIINLATAIANLLPLPEYDGYKVLKNSLTLQFGDLASEKFMMHTCIFVCAAVVFLSLFLIMTLNGGYWIFFVFFIVMIREILFFQKHTKNEIL